MRLKRDREMTTTGAIIGTGVAGVGIGKAVQKGIEKSENTKINKKVESDLREAEQTRRAQLDKVAGRRNKTEVELIEKEKSAIRDAAKGNKVKLAKLNEIDAEITSARRQNQRLHDVKQLKIERKFKGKTKAIKAAAEKETEAVKALAKKKGTKAGLIAAGTVGALSVGRMIKQKKEN